MAFILYPNTSASQRSPQVRGTRATHKSNSVARVETSFNKNQNEFVVISSLSPTTKTLHNTTRGRKELSPLPETRISQTYKSKVATDFDKSAKNKTNKNLKTWADAKANGNLTKAETERFSPYVLAKKEAEEHKSKLLPNIRKNDTSVPRPSNRALLTMPDTLSRPARTTRESECFTFALGKGNNDKVIRTVMEKRYWWKESTATGANANYDFCWYQTNKPINFSQLTVTKTSKKMANHFEFNREIGTKSHLIKNLQAYCDRTGLQLFKITPITFALDLYDQHYTADYQIFSNFFKNFGKRSEKQVEEAKAPAEIPKSPVSSKGKQAIPRISQKHLTNLCDTYYNGCNLWLLKPTDYNRGRGINLFNKLSTLEHYLKCFQNGEDENGNKTGSSSPTKSKATSSSSLNLVKSHRFVVQKYIEKPMLIDSRKFDARIWVLVDQEMNLYCFKEGYLRLSSEAFTLNETQIEDKYVHLTNNAVQKYGKNYGKHESGNIISLNDMEKYLPTDNPKVSMSKIKDRIHELIKISMESVKSKLNACDRKYCFEIFGYDFILDAEYNVYIIEVNSNPSIDESNKLLNVLVPRMIDDTFKLTIDKIFPPNLKNYKSEDIFKDGTSYPVPGYTNDENLWRYLTCLKDSSSKK